jgi:hypothetical protein
VILLFMEGRVADIQQNPGRRRISRLSFNPSEFQNGVAPSRKGAPESSLDLFREAGFKKGEPSYSSAFINELDQTGDIRLSCIRPRDASQ